MRVLFVGTGAAVLSFKESRRVPWTRRRTVATTLAMSDPAATSAVRSNAIFQSSGSATVTFHSPTPLAAGSVNLGDLDGLVPNAAIIGSTPLHFSSESINGGAIQASASDGTFTVLPEPATLGLASTAGLLLRRSHRRSYR